MIRSLATIVLAAALALGTARSAEPVAAAAPHAAGERGVFHARYTSQPAPVPLLALHSWTLTITDAAGTPIDGAQLTVMGGMPAHGHGLPTRPVVRPQGGGRYRIDGMRFHMPGHWVVAFRIRTATAIDTVTFPLELP